MNQRGGLALVIARFSVIARRPGRTLGAVAGCGLLLAACATAPQPVSRRPAASPAPVAAPALSPDQRLSLAIDLLGKGQVADARAQLQAVMAATVNDKAAMELLQSLDEDPKAALGDEHFDYTARPGDTFTTLAARFLHDPLKFYLLARYNGVDAPDSLAPGRALAIPRPRHRAAAHAPARAAGAVPPALDAARARSLRFAGLEALDRGEIRRAVALLQAAARVDPDDPLIKRDLARALRIQATVDGR